MEVNGSGAATGSAQPFDPVHKRTEADMQAADGKTFKVSKGAPQVILALVTDRNAVQASVDKAVK